MKHPHSGFTKLLHLPVESAADSSLHARFLALPASAEIETLIMAGA